MIIFTELSKMPKNEVMEIKNNLCITEEESLVFDLLVFSDKSYIEIANRIHKSRSSTWRVMSKLKEKILNEFKSRGVCTG